MAAKTKTNKADGGSVQLPKLTKAQTDAFDRMEKAQAALKRAKKHEQAVKECKAILDEAFGDRPLCVTSDGRIVQRSVDVREYNALPAKTVEIIRYKEVEPW